MSGEARLSGELVFATVEDWLAQADALAAAGRLDLSAVPRADSAGLSLLLELVRRARARGNTLSFQNANAQIGGLARFFGVDGVLSLSETQ